METRVKQQNVQRRLYLSNGLIDRDQVRVNKMPVDVSPMQSHKYRILCVDDDVLGTTMRAEILKEHGLSVVVFYSPLEVTCCDLSTFNLAILDFEMPGLNGRELLLRIRAMGPDSQSCCSPGAWQVFRVKIASCLRGVSTRACPFEPH
jgi:CheY-like chemotaxis protein